MVDASTPAEPTAVDRPALTPEQRALIKRAMEARVWASRAFTEPVAATLVDALTAYIALGHRFEQSGKVIRLVEDILARPELTPAQRVGRGR